MASVATVANVNQGQHWYSDIKIDEELVTAKGNILWNALSSVHLSRNVNSIKVELCVVAGNESEWNVGK